LAKAGAEPASKCTAAKVKNENSFRSLGSCLFYPRQGSNL
jgi:hypothetical protein